MKISIYVVIIILSVSTIVLTAEILTKRSKASASFALQDLRTLGGNSSNAAAINDNGVVVGRSVTKDGKIHAFLWDRENGMRDLNVITGTTGLRDCVDINSSGSVIGVSGQGSENEGFFWDSEIGLISLGPFLPVSVTDSNLICANPVSPEKDKPRLFQVLESGLIHESTIEIFATVTSIGNKGCISGISIPASGEWRPIGGLFVPQLDQIIRLSSGQESMPIDVNNTCDSVGRVGNVNTEATATLWHPDGNIITLGKLGQYWSEALALNDEGQVVGHSEPPVRNRMINRAYMKLQEWLSNDLRIRMSWETAFFWEKGIMYDLNDLAQTDLLGVYLSSANDINNSGEIVGNGYFSGQSMAYILTPTE